MATETRPFSGHLQASRSELGVPDRNVIANQSKSTKRSVRVRPVFSSPASGWLQSTDSLRLEEAIRCFYSFSTVRERFKSFFVIRFELFAVNYCGAKETVICFVGILCVCVCVIAVDRIREFSAFRGQPNRLLNRIAELPAEL